MSQHRDEPYRPPPPISLARISFQHRAGDVPAPVKANGREVQYVDAKGLCDGEL